MFKDRDAAKVLRLAQDLLESGDNISFTVRMSKHAEKPIPVFHPNGEHHSLVGFFEFDLNLTLMRYSSFQRRENSLAGCPAAEVWIDGNLIRQKVKNAKRHDEQLKKLFLSYDRSSSRLAWRGVLESDNGTVRSVCVAGNLSWECNTAR